MFLQKNCQRINDNVMYLIDNSIYFDEQCGRLLGRETEVMLGENEINCLKALINANGKVVSAEVLISHIWQSERNHAYDNSLRQTIHIIRSAFKKLSVDASVITTQVRNGYRLSDVRAVKNQRYAECSSLLASYPTQEFFGKTQQLLTYVLFIFFTLTLLFSLVLVSEYWITRWHYQSVYQAIFNDQDLSNPDREEGQWYQDTLTAHHMTENNINFSAHSDVSPASD